MRGSISLSLINPESQLEFSDLIGIDRRKRDRGTTAQWSLFEQDQARDVLAWQGVLDVRTLLLGFSTHHIQTTLLVVDGDFSTIVHDGPSDSIGLNEDEATGLKGLDALAFLLHAVAGEGGEVEAEDGGEKNENTNDFFHGTWVLFVTFVALLPVCTISHIH